MAATRPREDTEVLHAVPQEHLKSGGITSNVQDEDSGFEIFSLACRKQHSKKWLEQGKEQLMSTDIVSYLLAHNLPTVCVWLVISEVAGLDSITDTINTYFIGQTRQLPDPTMVLEGSSHHQEWYEEIRDVDERAIRKFLTAIMHVSIAGSSVPFTTSEAFFPRLLQLGQLYEAIVTEVDRIRFATKPGNVFIAIAIFHMVNNRVILEGYFVRFVLFASGIVPWFWSYRTRALVLGIFMHADSDHAPGLRAVVRRMVDYELRREIEQVWASESYLTQFLLAPSHVVYLHTMSTGAQVKWVIFLLVWCILIIHATHGDEHYDGECDEVVARNAG